MALEKMYLYATEEIETSVFYKYRERGRLRRQKMLRLAMHKIRFGDFYKLGASLKTFVP